MVMALISIGIESQNRAYDDNHLQSGQNTLGGTRMVSLSLLDPCH